MIRIVQHDFSNPPGRVKIAGLFVAGAIALAALDAGLALQPAPVPATTTAARLAPPEESSGVHSLAYYPEQLAALNSLASFRPEAESGAGDIAAQAVSPPAPVLPPVSQASAAPGSGAPSAAKSTRRVDQAAKTTPPHAATASASTLAAAEPDSVRVFGVAVPGGAEIASRASSLRESAAHWGEATWELGAKAASFWR
ncbi:hypothetical protein [Rhodoblastus sp.]|uniref:hypothetical protein n=1 Tax=Rhodoblastus sp. TaxID=1962975 RepID=UPI0035B07F2B